MKITPFFPCLCFLCGLTSPQNPASGGPVSPGSRTPTRPYSAARTATDSTKTVRPDSINPRPITPAGQLTGELTLSTGFHATRGLETPRAQVTPWDLSGHLTLNTRSGWTIPLQLIWRSQDNRYGQPCNQMGVSPRYKNWLTLHGGYRNVLFSPLTLAGHTFLGAGVELNPGLLRVGAVVGQFNRAVNAHYADPDRIAMFRRAGYSAKVGVGKERNYLDLILLRAADDVHSVQTDDLTRTPPAENVVLGLSGRLKLRKKLSVEFDAAGSAYTGDVREEAAAVGTSSDTRLRYRGPLAKLFTVRQSTQLRTALQTSVSYRTKKADLKLQYKRVEPNYKSMGVYYLQTDVENFTVAPKLRLAKKRLYLGTSLGWQHDNLFNQKRARTNRLIGSLSASYSSDKDLTLDLAYANYGITQRAGYRPLNDTTRMAQNNQTLSGSVCKRWTGETMLHALSGSATYQALRDLNPFTTDLSRTWDYRVDYAGQDLTGKLDLNVGYGYTLSKALLSTTYHGPSVSMGKKVLSGNKLGLLLTVSYLKSRETLTGFTQNGTVLNSALSIDYQLTPVHRLSATWANSQNWGQQTGRQQQGTVRYSATF